VAYGDENGHSGPVPWEEFEYMEYLYRMDDLNDEWHKAFAIAHRNPDEDSARVEAADEEWQRCGRALEETALEFAAYAARLRMGVAK
jgi:hypothetical protein